MLAEALEAAGGLIVAGWGAHRLGLIGSTPEQRAYAAARICQRHRTIARLETETHDGRVVSTSTIEHLRTCERPACSRDYMRLSKAAMHAAQTAAEVLRTLRSHLDETGIAPAVRDDVESHLGRYQRDAAAALDYAGQWFDR